LFEKEEETRFIKEKTVTEHVIHAVTHAYEYPKSVIHSVGKTAKKQLSHAANVVEDSLQQLTSTTGSKQLRIGMSISIHHYYYHHYNRDRHPPTNPLYSLLSLSLSVPELYIH
jgi:DNA-binding protein